MTDLFDINGAPAPAPKPDDNQTGSVLDELVGEGKKYATVEDLAKSRVEADRFINQLQTETSGLREDLNKRATIEDFMTAINDREAPAPASNPVTNPGETPPAPTAEQTKGMSEKELRAFVEQQLKQDKDRSTAEANLAQVKTKLESAWGPEFPYRLRDKAKELGVSEDYLTQLATEAPSAFFAAVRVDDTQQVQGNVAPPRSATTSSFSDNQAGQKNFKYFEKMRKENSREYWSPKVQNEMHKMAGELGDSFYA